MEYTQEQLKRLHAELLDILAEIIRVCEITATPYFIQGGTAIGAHFNRGIVPWDDDIDIGMTRENYERFLREAPQHLSKGYFLQWYGSEPDTPFYFAKVRRDNTLFVGNDEKGLPIHHGIYVDIFPYDRIPDNARREMLQRAEVGFWVNCFIAKSVWLWRWFSSRPKAERLPKSFVSCVMLKIVSSLLSKKVIYKLMYNAMTRYNNTECRYVNIVRMSRDQIAVKAIENPVKMPFAHLEVWAPSDLESYLRHHYRNLRPVLPKEEQQNHAPEELSFDVAGDTAGQTNNSTKA